MSPFDDNSYAVIRLKTDQVSSRSTFLPFGAHTCITPLSDALMPHSVC